MENDNSPYGDHYLCGRCSDVVSVCVLGTCVGNADLPGCGGPTSYPTYKWCRQCAKKHNICNGCGALAPATQPAA